MAKRLSFDLKPRQPMQVPFARWSAEPKKVGAMVPKDEVTI